MGEGGGRDVPRDVPQQQKVGGNRIAIVVTGSSNVCFESRTVHVLHDLFSPKFVVVISLILFLLSSTSFPLFLLPSREHPQLLKVATDTPSWSKSEISFAWYASFHEFCVSELSSFPFH